MFDDILVYGKKSEEHDKNLRAVQVRLQEKGLTLNKSKCKLHQKSVEYFGHVFSSDGVKASPTKLEAISQLKPPTNVSEVRSVLGLTNYVGSRFIPNYAALTHSLRELTKKHNKWDWNEEHTASFNTLKKALENSVTLSYFDVNKETEVYVDASPVGVCAILMQRSKDNALNIIKCASKSLTGPESRYS